jgi:hypothetical protein
VSVPRSAVVKLPPRVRDEVASTVVVPAELDQVPPKFALEPPVKLMLPVFDHVPLRLTLPPPVQLMLPVVLKLPLKLAVDAFTLIFPALLQFVALIAR